MGVKERLRSRSRHLQLVKARSIEEKTTPVSSPTFSEWEHASASLLPRTLRQEALATPDAEHEIIFQPSAGTERFEPKQGTASGMGLCQLAQSLQLRAGSIQIDPQASPQPVSVRTSSKQSKDLLSNDLSTGHHSAINQQSTSLPVMTAGLLASQRAVPKHIPLASTSPVLDQYEANNLVGRENQDSQGLPLLPRPLSAASSGAKFPSQTSSCQSNNEHRDGRVPDHRTEQSVDPNHADRQIPLTPLTPVGTPVDVPAQMTLPDNFPRQNTVHTDVSTQRLPAVTQECIYRQTTEIIQKPISRDIHVHHYYEYLQPIKVVEILPAKHWLLNLETGEKTEIPEPEGWVIPESMRPTKPDLSRVKKESRHYLVNDEYPNGVAEQLPADEREDVHRSATKPNERGKTAAEPAPSSVNVDKYDDDDDSLSSVAPSLHAPHRTSHSPPPATTP
ncbi:hypothetical protein DV736_g535, partial [Chaetothyriales sp. CBS 134916]